MAFAVRVGALCGTMAVGVGLGLFYVTGGTKNARAKRENWSKNHFWQNNAVSCLPK